MAGGTGSVPAGAPPASALGLNNVNMSGGGSGSYGGGIFGSSGGQSSTSSPAAMAAMGMGSAGSGTRETNPALAAALQSASQQNPSYTSGAPSASGLSRSGGMFGTGYGAQYGMPSGGQYGGMSSGGGQFGGMSPVQALSMGLIGGGQQGGFAANPYAGNGIQTGGLSSSDYQARVNQINQAYNSTGQISPADQQFMQMVRSNTAMMNPANQGSPYQQSSPNQMYGNGYSGYMRPPSPYMSQFTPGMRSPYSPSAYANASYAAPRPINTYTNTPAQQQAVSQQQSEQKLKMDEMQKRMDEMEAQRQQAQYYNDSPGGSGWSSK